MGRRDVLGSLLPPHSKRSKWIGEGEIRAEPVLEGRPAVHRIERDRIVCVLRRGAGKQLDQHLGGLRPVPILGDVLNQKRLADEAGPQETWPENAHQEFPDLYAALTPRVRGFLRRRLDDREVDDVLGEVFLVVWRRWADMPVPRAERESWVFGVADLCVRASRRRTSRYTQLLARIQGAVSPAPPVEPDTAVLGSLTAEALLALLPSEHAHLARRAHLDEAPVAAIAEELGISESAVTSRTWRARQALRVIIESEREAEGDHEPRS